MQLKKSILLWTMIFAAVYFTLGAVAQLCGLQFRAWVRASAALLIAVGAAIGIFQLLRRIPKAWVKTAAMLLWLAGVIAGGAYGFLIFVFNFTPERTEIYDGKACVVETKTTLFDEWDNYYEKHGLFFRGTDVLYSYDYE